MTATSPASRPARTNRLIHATSPYLLQHAHNPVDWYPWGPEALAKARKEDKPIFLSIGYSACHWCHVMERESFENEEVAGILNEAFVSIKVDREERPDLDEIYMSATLIYNQGQGGWPMSVFLTPEQKPFFAGTYFPPRSMYGRPGFKELLTTIARLWKEDRPRVLQSSESLTRAVREFGGLQPGGEVLPPDLPSAVADALAEAFDPRTGGMTGGGTNKFPPSLALTLMLRQYHRSVKAGQPRRALLDKIELTLDHMARGGIYDHLGGGICRYSTDVEWLVPHFEKMLYDQALVSGAYIEAFQATRNPRWAAVGRDIFDYVLRDLQSPEGGFYSARDADSEGVEGKFYVWSRKEVLSVLGPRAGELVCSYYDVSDAGNWEGHNILRVQRDAKTVAGLNGVQVGELEAALAEGRRKLFEARERRVPPHRDDKVLTGWNGLMIASLARGGAALGEEKYVQAAGRAADFILKQVSDNGRLLRTWRAGRGHTFGYLDDYAFFIEGLLDLYAATFEVRWLEEAVRLNDDLIRHFWDERDGAFFYTADDAEPLLVRTKDSRDGAVPSGNSVALMNLLRLAAMLDRADLRHKAEGLMKAFAGTVGRSPFGFDRFLAGLDFYHAPPREVVIVGPIGDEATRALIRAVRQVYDPYRVVMLSDPASPDAARRERLMPLLAGKGLVGGKPAAFVCRNRTCKRPVTDAGELLRELETPD
ncbi:MAG: thioredoxin domain-containing protein [Phycisphaerae bacterium]